MVGFTAIILAALGYVANQNRHKQMFTYNLVIGFADDPVVTRAFQQLEEHYYSDRYIDWNDLSEEDQRGLVSLYGQAEYICFAYMKNLIHKPTVDEIIVRQIFVTYMTLRPHIQKRQKEDPGFLEWLEKFCTEGPWATRYRRKLKSFVKPMSRK